MIIEKNIDIDRFNNSNYIFSPRDIERMVISDITKIHFQYVHQMETKIPGEISPVSQPITFIGDKLFFIITDDSRFVYSSLSINNITTQIGILLNSKIYYDSRLTNEVVVGSDISEIESYINRKFRKEKLEKIKNANNTRI